MGCLCVLEPEMVYDNKMECEINFFVDSDYCKILIYILKSPNSLRLVIYLCVAFCTISVFSSPSLFSQMHASRQIMITTVCCCCCFFLSFFSFHFIYRLSIENPVLNLIRHTEGQRGKNTRFFLCLSNRNLFSFRMKF